MNEGIRFRQWQDTISEDITKDPLWRLQVYQLSLYLAHLAWEDVTKLRDDNRTRSVADQLYRAICSIGANIAEGYSRSSHRDQARFYEYALGSARESRDWYYKSRHIIGENCLVDRYTTLTQIIRLLMTIIPRQRNMAKEENSEYSLEPTNTLEDS